MLVAIDQRRRPADQLDEPPVLGLPLGPDVGKADPARHDPPEERPERVERAVGPHQRWHLMG